MVLIASYCAYTLRFGFTAITSRETMNVKPTYFLRLRDDAMSEVEGLGECALFRGLSADDTPDYEHRLSDFCRRINRGQDADPQGSSSIAFGYESALADLRSGGRRQPFGAMPKTPEEGIRINGLVWMGSIEQMRSRAAEKIAQGFRCLKFKIGGQRFDDELELLRRLRKEWRESELEIRLDANGAFTPDNALDRLESLARFGIHSIEQPIRAGQWDTMAEICRRSPIAIALDEELIGCEHHDEMLDAVSPQYIILKPTLCGGFMGADRWIEAAEKRGIGWWATSVLESDIGLNAIARWVYAKHPDIPQGLGTGGLYTNNIGSPLRLAADRLYSDPAGKWSLPSLQWYTPV